MPRLSVWFVRASLIYLLAGFTLGALMLAEKGVPYYPGIFLVLPIHMEFLLVGWLVQFAMGVAYWILPRIGDGTLRGSERPIWASFTLLNAGLLLAAAQNLTPLALIAGRLLEFLGLLIYVVASWRRLRPMAGGVQRQVVR
jgi:hypothetical protein